MIPFEMAEPTSLKEAMSLLDPQEPTIRAVAGGTALMLMMKAGVFQPSLLVCLHGSSPTTRASRSPAAARCASAPWRRLSEVEHDANVAARLPVLKRAMRTLSNRARAQRRARRRRAGAWRSAHGLAAGAHRARRHASRSAVRTAIATLPLEELYAGYYETVLEKNELITAVTVPALNGRKAAYMKVTSRSADDWPALGVAVSFALKDGAIRDPVVVVSAATEKVTRMAARRAGACKARRPTMRC